MQNIDFNYYYDLYRKTRKGVDWGSRFKVLIRELDRSVSTISVEIGISEVDLFQVLNGTHIPSFLMLSELSKTFHVNPEWLFNIKSDGSILYDSLRKRGSEHDICKRILVIKGNDNDFTFSSKTAVSFMSLQRIENNSRIKELTIRKISSGYHVGLEWILCGDEKCKDYPVDQDMIAALWKNEVLRRKIFDLMGRKEFAFQVPAELINTYDKSDNENMGLIGSRIKYCRKCRGMTIKEVADLSFISRRTIERWENGQTMPNSLGIRRVAEILDTGEEFLLNGDITRMNCPCDKQMIIFLKENPVIRFEIWKQVE